MSDDFPVRITLYLWYCNLAGSVLLTITAILMAVFIENHSSIFAFVIVGVIGYCYLSLRISLKEIGATRQIMNT